MYSYFIPCWQVWFWAVAPARQRFGGDGHIVSFVNASEAWLWPFASPIRLTGRQILNDRPVEYHAQFVEPGTVARVIAIELEVPHARPETGLSGN